MEVTKQSITYGYWEEKYSPIEDEYGYPRVFDTHDDWQYISTISPLNVWTTVEGDNDSYVITNGVSMVNRLEYYVTKVPWNEGEYIEVH